MAAAAAPPCCGIAFVVPRGFEDIALSEIQRKVGPFLGPDCTFTALPYFGLCFLDRPLRLDSELASFAAAASELVTVESVVAVVGTVALDVSVIEDAEADKLARHDYVADRAAAAAGLQWAEALEAWRRCTQLGFAFQEPPGKAVAAAAQPRGTTAAAGGAGEEDTPAGRASSEELACPAPAAAADRQPGTQAAAAGPVADTSAGAAGPCRPPSSAAAPGLSDRVGRATTAGPALGHGIGASAGGSGGVDACCSCSSSSGEPLIRFRASVSRFEYKSPLNMGTQDFASAIGKAGVEVLQGRLGQKVKVDLTGFSLELMCILTPVHSGHPHATFAGAAAAAPAACSVPETATCAGTATAAAGGAAGAGSHSASCEQVAAAPPAGSDGRGSSPGDPAPAAAAAAAVAPSVPLQPFPPSQQRPTQVQAHLGFVLPLGSGPAIKYRNRIVFGRTSLRPSVAACLVHLAAPEPGDVVVDMCCGSGTIPLEAAAHLPSTFCLGGDLEAEAVVNGAATNVRHADEAAGAGAGRRQGPKDLAVWSAARLPLACGCVDRLVSDLPWGMRELSFRACQKLYPPLMREAARVLRAGTGRAVLVTGERKLMRLALEMHSCGLELVEERDVVIGYRVGAYVLRKAECGTQAASHAGYNVRRLRREAEAEVARDAEAAGTDGAVAGGVTVGLEGAGDGGRVDSKQL